MPQDDNLVLGGASVRSEGTEPVVARCGCGIFSDLPAPGAGLMDFSLLIFPIFHFFLGR